MENFTFIINYFRKITKHECAWLHTWTFMFILQYVFFFLHATVALTCTFVELAGLCDVPLAEFGPLSDRWSFAVDVITGHDRV